MSHPHDRLLRYIVSRHEYAAALARVVLPSAVVPLVDFAGLRVVDGRQLDPELRERIVDLLFELPFHGGGAGWLNLIVEHQSQSDRWMALRTYAATGQRWQQWLRDHPQAEGLPMVLTVVVSHDPAGWRAATDVAGLVALTSAQRAVFGAFVPSTPFHLFDLTAVDERRLRLGAEAAAVELMLLCFKHARDGAALVRMLRERIALVAAVARAPDGAQATIALLRYLAQVTGGGETATVVYASFVEITRSVEPVVAKEIEAVNFEEFVDRYGQNWRAAYAERLKAQWRAELLLEAKRETLTHQLALRFRLDPLPAWLVERVAGADLAALAAAEERILFAERPEDVLPGEGQ